MSETGGFCRTPRAAMIKPDIRFAAGYGREPTFRSPTFDWQKANARVDERSDPSRLPRRRLPDPVTGHDGGACVWMLEVVRPADHQSACGFINRRRAGGADFQSGPGTVDGRDSLPRLPRGAKLFVEPVQHSLIEQRSVLHLAVAVGALLGGEAHQRLRAAQRFHKCAGPGREHVVLRRGN
jgi:hypothetical protein